MKNEKQKTVFVVVVRGFIVRNILRSGVLDHLKNEGARVVILFYNVRNKPLPDYLREEFEDKNVVVESVPAAPRMRFYRPFILFENALIFNRVNKKIRTVMEGKSKFLFFLKSLFFVPLSKLHFLKKVARVVDKKFFSNDFYAPYFEKYNPDVVFSTSITSKLDVDIMKEAAKRSVPTVGMPKVWDNITTKFYRYVPDRIIVQNAQMKKDMVYYQRINQDIIQVTGFPQFDWYRKKEIIMPREEFFKSVGLDPNKKLIFWGSTGIWTPDDTNISHILINFIENNKLAKPTNLFIRSHFTDAKYKRFDHLREHKNVFVDDNFHFSDFFRYDVDPDMGEIRKFVNSMYHADLLITLCSTLTLDAFCLDKPVINTAFKDLYDKKGRDISPIMYGHDHYQPILEYNSIDLVFSEKELLESINNYLLHLEYKKEERRWALDHLCYKVDGQSSERVANTILSFA